jgi:outer membrane protein TolC
MNVMKISFLLVLMLSGGILLGQEQPYMLSLAQAQEYALQHNRSILNARDQVESSKKKVYETIANGLPQIEGSLDYMTYFNYELYLDFGGGGGAGFEQLFTDPDIDAGDIKVLQALGSMFGSSEPIIMDDQFSGKIQVSQLIFSGQYIAGIQGAKIARRLADQNLLSNELDVKENVTNSYYNILTTEQTLRILGENLDNLNSLLEHTHNLFKAGLAEETDVDRIRMSVSQLKNTQKSLERLKQLNYNLLKFQLGVAPDASISLTDSLEYFIENINPDVALVNNFDVNNNVNYQMIESQVKMTKKQVDMQYWAYTPTIAGFYSYTEKFITTGFDMTPNHLAGVSVSVPIFSSGMRNSQVSQAKNKS